MIILQRAMRKCAHADKFLILIIHLALGERIGAREMNRQMPS